MAKTIDRRIAHSLYEALTLKLRNIHVAPAPPTGAVQFLGFADFQISLLGHPFLNLVGNSLKLIDGRLHFDPNYEEGKGAKVGQKFNVWAPTSGEARAVITALLEQCPEVEEMKNEAAKVSAGNQKTAKVSNPF